MTATIPFHDALHRLTQIAATTGLMLVRITALDKNNRYTARPIEFDDNGETQLVGTDTLTVTNLAEPATVAGQISADTDAVAVDVEGQWVVFVQPASTLLFPAKVISSNGNAAYTVREQVVTGSGTFANKQGASNITAHNLAELSLGPGAAVDNDTIVLAATFVDNGNPPTLRYVFSHPAYAKFLN